MSDEIPPYIDEESRSLESVPMEPQPVLSAETELSGGETLPDQPLSGPAGDSSELPPTPEVAARSPKAMVIGLGVAAEMGSAEMGSERKWGQGANLDKISRFPSLLACHGACVLNFPVPITT